MANPVWSGERSIDGKAQVCVCDVLINVHRLQVSLSSGGFELHRNHFLYDVEEDGLHLRFFFPSLSRGLI
jgi:hypothetical protein